MFPRQGSVVRAANAGVGLWAGFELSVGQGKTATVVTELVNLSCQANVPLEMYAWCAHSVPEQRHELEK